MATECKDLRHLLAEVATWPGWRVENRTAGYRVFPPDGQTPFSAPHGPRQPYRAIRNLRAKIRRAGGRI